MASYLDIQIFSDLIRSKRGFRGLREVAQEIGISPSTISRVENGKIPDIDNFLALCDWLDIPPAEFIKDTKNQRKQDDYSYSSICTKLRCDGRVNKAISDAIATLIESIYKE